MEKTFYLKKRSDLYLSATNNHLKITIKDINTQELSQNIKQEEPKIINIEATEIINKIVSDFLLKYYELSKDNKKTNTLEILNHYNTLHKEDKISVQLLGRTIKKTFKEVYSQRKAFNISEEREDGKIIKKIVRSTIYNIKLKNQPHAINK